ncbi:MAG: hypothetical protein IRY97_08230, partial [Thermomicrobiaceae bacterium]|nr:hypothetical protein [Thermomicrobiaceae bacterium]
MRLAWRVGLALATVLALGVVAGAGRVAAPPPTRAAPEQVYLALGDSIAAGLVTSLPRTRGYPALVRDLIERRDRASGEPAQVSLVNLA